MATCVDPPLLAPEPVIADDTDGADRTGRASAAQTEPGLCV